MKCEGVGQLLSEYIDDALKPQDRAAVQLHIRQCANCARALEGLRRTVSLLSAVPQVDLPADFRQRLRQRLAVASGAAIASTANAANATGVARPATVVDVAETAARETERVRLRRSWAWWGMPAGAAAAALLVGLLLFPGRPGNLERSVDRNPSLAGQEAREGAVLSEGSQAAGDPGQETPSVPAAVVAVGPQGSESPAPLEQPEAAQPVGGNVDPEPAVPAGKETVAVAVDEPVVTDPPPTPGDTRPSDVSVATHHDGGMPFPAAEEEAWRLSADLTLEVESLESVAGRLQDLGKTLNADLDIFTAPAAERAVLQVSSDGFAAALEAVAQLGVVLDQRVARDDVSDQMAQIRAGLAGLQTELAALQGTDGGQGGDAVAVAAVKERMEALQQELSFLEGATGRATVVIYLTERR